MSGRSSPGCPVPVADADFLGGGLCLSSPGSRHQTTLAATVLLMQSPFLIFLGYVVVIHFILLAFGIWGVIASYIAGLRGGDKLTAFKSGVVLGPIGAAIALYKKDSVPDVEVTCPHCKTRQEVAGDLDWFECWQCEERSNIAANT